MQLEIYNPTQGTQLPTIEWNFDALKTWLEDGLASYKGRVYDDSQINEAKKDAANLRKLKEAIDGKRKELKRDYLEPYEAFASQAKLLTDMIDKQIEEISGQVKAYDTRWKEEKRQRIEAEIYGPMIGDLAGLVPYDRLHEAKWLNRTASDSQISEALGTKIDRINSGLFAINNMELEPDLEAAVKAAFMRHFDLSEAMAEKEQIERMRAKTESEKPVENTVSFDEYCLKGKDGKPMSNWAAKPGTMIRKVALVQALREAFPEDLQALYDAEEMGVVPTTETFAPVDADPEPMQIDYPQDIPQDTAPQTDAVRDFFGEEVEG